MKVLKFGGTSVGSTKNLHKITDILKSDNENKIVVCSAMSGVTDELIRVTEKMRDQNFDAISRQLYFLKEKHIEVVETLIVDSDIRDELKNYLSEVFSEIFEWSSETFSETVKSKIITCGESVLTHIFSGYLNSIGIENLLLNAKEFMHVDSVDNPNIDKVSFLLNEVLNTKTQSKLYITQGFVCRDINNQISHLRRGGSDYSATIIAAAVGAKEVQIWTDINGLHNNDPRYVSNTYPISHLTYKEASQMAYFGAKILHPQTVSPVKEKEIPVWIKNTFEPNEFGTLISNKVYQRGLKAISAKDGIITINIKSNGVLLAHKYFKKTFDIFDKYQISIDMVTTSEVEISLTIDENTKHLHKLVDELRRFSKVVVNKSSSIICIVGESLLEDKSCSKIFDILNCIPLKMISFGACSNSISILVDTKNKVYALKYLNKKLFNQHPEKYITSAI